VRLTIPATLIFATVALLVALSSGAATPGSGTVGPATPTVAWTGPDRDASTEGPSDAECTEPADGPTDPFPGFCDDFSLSVSVSSSYWTTHTGGVDVTITGNTPAEDFDLYVYDKNGNEVGRSGLPGGLENVFLACPTSELSPYKVRAVYFTTTANTPPGPGYNGSATFSSQTGDCRPEPTTTPIFGHTAVDFDPATIVSAHFLGSEPQTTIERPMSFTPGSAGIDPKRFWVDWPLSSRSNIGQLNRSVDAGLSFRPIIDLTCAARSRPNCLTGGGGDTEEDVNLASGHVFFADQEVLVNEAFAASFDHGDTWNTQTAVSNGTTGTDRQWIATTDNTVKVAGLDLEGFLTYHVPPTLYVQGITANGVAIPQPAPQVTNVAQSGQPRVDNNPASPGHGWIYHPFINFLGGGTSVATAKSSSYLLPTDWHVSKASQTAATSFPWIAIDSAGNSYLIWDSGGVVYYAYSSINDPANNPSQGGIPGTKWSPRARVSLPSVGSAVFPEAIGGSPGRIGITYDGTTEFTGVPDDAPPGAHWNTYAAVITAANTATPTVLTGIASHRFIHMGNICTSGTGCTEPGDRSLLDMIDVGVTREGRLGVVFTDNFSTFAERPGGEDESPFTHFAKQASGPSILSASDVTPAGGSEGANDATWPNRLYTSPGQNLPSLDIRDVSITRSGASIVARIRLATAAASQMQSDLTAFNAVPCVTVPPPCADRLQYVVRFSTATELYHLSMEFLPTGARRFLGGRLDTNDKVLNPANPTTSGVIAAGYHTDFAATGTVSGNTITMTAPASSFPPGLGSGTKLFSVTGFSMAGPLEASETLASDVMRTVDASPPSDNTLP
jgi:hypothetical protein